MLNKIYKRAKSIIPSPFKKFLHFGPRSLTIDIASCNLRCKMCPRGGVSSLVNNKKGLMDFKLFKNIVDKITDEKYIFQHLNFGNWGESLLNSCFPEMVRYAKLKLSPIGTYLATNLTCLKDPSAIIRSGLDGMGVSISGMTQEVYSKNHIGGDINLVLENLKALAFYKKQLRSDIKILMLFHDYVYNKEEAQLGRSFCKDNGIEFRLFRCHIPSLEECIAWHKEKERWTKFYGQFIDMEREQRLMRTLSDYRECDMLNNMVVIDFDGKIYRCCAVYEEKYFLGSFFDYTIKDIRKIKSEICVLCAKTPLSFR